MNKQIPHIYIFLWIVYSLQGTLYLSGSWTSRLLLVVLVAVSLFFYCYANIKFKLPTAMRILSVLVLAWSFYGIQPILIGTGTTAFPVLSYSYLRAIYISILPIYSFYVFVKKGLLDENAIKRWFFVFLITAIINYFQYQNDALVNSLDDEITNNVGYAFLSLLPLLPLFCKKPIIQYGLLAICFYFILIGFKRGAIFAGVLCTVWMVFRTLKEVQLGGRRHSLRRIVLVLIVLISISLGVVFVRDLLVSSDYFVYRLEKTLEGSSSNRDLLYSFFFSHFIHETNPIKFLFGNGAYGTIKLYFNFAHNDWLEIAIDNGLVVLVLYASYWISLISMLLKGKRESVASLMLGMFIIIYLIRTMISMSYNSISLYAACALGYSLANYEQRRSN